MGAAVIGALRVDLNLGTAGWDAGLKRVQAQADKVGGGFKKIGAGITTAGVAMTAAVTGPLVALVAKAIPAARESAQAIGQVRAALESMGPAAGRTEAQLKGAATELMHLSTFDDDEILRKVTANMLTFGNVAGEQFDRAQRAAVDLSARMGTDLQASAIMLGKALNDPAKGLSALRRVGIQFTADQQKQIKAMAAAGDTAGAQAVMLKELERQFGGSAKALRDATPGADLKNAWDDFQETIGGIAIKVLPPLTSGLGAVLDKFNQLPAPVQASAVGFAAIAAVLGPMMLVLGPLVSGIGALIPLIVGWGAAFTTAATAAGGFIPLLAPFLPVLVGLAAAAGAAYLAWKNWDQVGPILAAVGEALAAALGPSVLNMLSALKDAATALWHSAFMDDIRTVIGWLGQLGAAVLKSIGAEIPGILRALGALFKGVFDSIAAAIRLVVAILSGDWAGAWTQAKALVGAVVTAIIGIFKGLTSAAIAAVSSLVHSVDEWMGGKLSAVWDRVKQGVDKVTGFFRGLWDAVVGHSYIPDMVDGIQAQMARLDAVMVAPVGKATAKAAEAFKALAAEVQPLLDRLFPDAAKMNQLEKDIALINRAQKGGAIGADVAGQAKGALYNEAFPVEEPAFLEAASQPLGDFNVSIDSVIGKLPDLSAAAQDTTAKMVEAFAGMARDVLGSLRGMVSAFKGGDILGGLTQLLDIVVQVAGLFKTGGAFAPRQSVNVTGGTGGMSFGGNRAMGGPVVPGKAYRVGERGQEWFSPSTRGRIVPDAAGGRAGNVYNFEGNLLTPDFWAEIKKGDDEAKLSGALGGAQLSASRLQRRSRRNLYGGR